MFKRSAQRKRSRMRRGGRVVECTALEMRHTCKGIVGSNPTLSAIKIKLHIFIHPVTAISPESVKTTKFGDL